MKHYADILSVYMLIYHCDMSQGQAISYWKGSERKDQAIIYSDQMLCIKAPSMTLPRYQRAMLVHSSTLDYMWTSYHKSLPTIASQAQLCHGRRVNAFLCVSLESDQIIWGKKHTKCKYTNKCMDNALEVIGFLKWQFAQKWKFCHHLVTLKLFQTCISFFLLLSTKDDILKNICNQTVDSSHWLPQNRKNTMEVNCKLTEFSFLSELFP